MTYPATPKRGMTFVKECIHCDQTEEMIVNKVRKKNQNEDGSFCYTLEMDCPNCGYTNGQYKPIWYNLYSLGCMHY